MTRKLRVLVAGGGLGGSEALLALAAHAAALAGHDLRARGQADVLPIGDGVAGTVKFGALATHDARRAVHAIARRAGASAPQEPPLDGPGGVLMTGGHPRALGTAAPAREPHVPLWRPDGKVRARYLQRVLPEPELAEPAAA
jgi:hypothetical protein